MNTNDKFGLHWYKPTILCHLVSQWPTSRLHFPVPWLESRDPRSGREPSILGVTLHPVGVQDVARHGGPAAGGGHGGPVVLPQKIGFTKASCYSLNREFQRSLSLTIVFRQLFGGWRFRAVDMFVFGMTVAINKQPFFAWGIPFCFQRSFFYINFDQRRWRGWRMPCGRVKRVSQRPTS